MSQNPAMPIDELWHLGKQEDWEAALKRYDEAILKRNVAIEKELNAIDPEHVRQMSPKEWFDFLHDKYIPWKYTDTRWRDRNQGLLREYQDYDRGLVDLCDIKRRMFEGATNIEKTLRLMDEIKGIGIAGASGILALLFPNRYGTVDQMVVISLREVTGLDDAEAIEKMRGKASLTSQDAMILIRVMADKAAELNKTFRNAIRHWRPRDIDMVLWGNRPEKKGRCGAASDPRLHID